jgi:endoglucanase
MTAWSSWSSGYVQEPEKFKAHAVTVADAAIELGIYVIIDFHCEGDNSGNVEKAKIFFREMAQKYSDVPNVIYEVWNEPTKQSWNALIRPYCVAVLAEIRQYDPLNLVLCGTETWSQKVEDAAKNPIPDVNIAYVLHFYSNLHGPWLYQKKHTLGVPVFVSEWGTPGQHPNTQGFVDWLTTQRVPHCSWAANNKAEPLSYFVPGCTNTTGPWNLNADLTETGKIFQKLISNWKPSTDTPVPAPPVPVPVPALPAPAPPAPTPPVRPPTPAPQPIVRVEAEAFKNRASSVQIQNNKSIQFTQSRAWVTYELRIPRAGSYLLQLFVQSPQGGQFRVDYDAGKTVVGTLTLPSMNTWYTAQQRIVLPMGTIRLGLFNLGTTAWGLDWFTLTPHE